MQFFVMAILLATVPGPVPNVLADEEAVLRGALAIRARTIEATTGFRFDAGWQPKAYFEYLSKGQGRHAGGQYVVETGDVLIALALWPQFNIDLGKPLRLATPQELETTEAFRDIADHELGHALADQISRRNNLGPWFTEKFKESLRPSESFGLNVVAEGVGTYFQNGGRPEYPGTSGEGWFPTIGENTVGYTYELVVYRGGAWLVYDVLHRYGERGLLWLIAHPFSAEGDMRARALAYRERALRELAQ